MTRSERIALAAVVSLFALGYALYLILQGERRKGAILIASSVAAFVVVIGVIVPAFNEAGTYGYTSAYGDLLSRPWLIPGRLVTPPLAPILAMAAADGLARISSRMHEATATRFTAAVAAACVVLSAFVPGRQPLWRVFAPGITA